MRRKFLIDQLSMDWIHDIFSLLEDEMSIGKLVNLAEQRGTKFGKRRDIFNRLVDLKLLKKSNPGALITFTEKGMTVKKLYLRASEQLPDVLHFLHILESFRPGQREYFITYRLATELFIKHKIISKNLYMELISELETIFPDACPIGGIDQTSIRKASVFIKQILNEVIELRTFIDPLFFAYGIQEYIKLKSSENSNAILLTTEVRRDISLLFLLDESSMESMIDRAVRVTGAFQKRYSVAGTFLNILMSTELR